jgi:aldehyde dehydrogenase (NAD+)
MAITVPPTQPGVYVDNSAVSGSGERIDVFDPSTGELLTSVEAGSAEDVDRAAQAAAGAAETWAAVPPVERGRVLARCSAAILASADELVELDVHDAGLPRSLARRDVEAAARYFEYYAGLADKLHGETIPLGANALDYTIREPWGVCGIVLPFNFPLQVTARDVAPALSVGNTVVLKTAEQAPLSVLAVVEKLWEAGLPPGVLGVVVGGGAVGEALVRHPLVEHVTFTGSQATGRRVMAACADTLKASTIELGGKSPHIVFEDGSIDAAVAAILGTTFRTTGQACSAGTRLLVHESAHDEAVAALARAVGELTVGIADDDPDVGPLVSAKQRDTVVAGIRGSLDEGATAAAGGGPPAAPELQGGYFVEPTVLHGVARDALAAREEFFGPVLTVLTFANDDDAIELANATDYGLVAGVWTHDVSRAHKVARALKAGQVFVNNYGVGGGVELPFGGYKRSGVGRVKGIAGALEYTQIKNICVAL